MNITNRISKRTIRLNYILAYFAIAFSGIHFFNGQVNMKIVFTILLGIIFILKNKKFDVSLIYISLLFLFVIFLQDYRFGGISIRNYVSFLMYYVFTPYFLIKIIGDNAPKYIIDVLVIYCVISLVFWSLSNLYQPFYNFTSTIAPKFGTDPIPEVNEQFIIYSYEPYRSLVYGNVIRNPGPFNEPGSFALFLILALIFNLIKNRGQIDNKSKIIIITILTTFSTATYFSLILLLGYRVVRTKVNIVIKLFLMVLFVIGTYFLVIKPSFMLDKVVSHYKYETSVSLNTPTSGRFLGARKSLYVLKKYPLYGRGLISGTRVEDLGSKEAASYGIMGFSSNVGVVLALIYLTLTWKAISYYINKYKWSPKFTKWAFASLMVSMFSQNFCKSTVFIMLIFIPLIFNKIRKVTSSVL